MSTSFEILFWLIHKHLIADFYLQFPWMIKYKGNYGHPGGIAHSGLHGIFTSIVLSFFATPLIALALGLLDFLIHYHIDWTKSNIVKRKGYSNTDSIYWILFGTDQWLHIMTYFFMAHLIVHSHV
jgi:hypothetical protein